MRPGIRRKEWVQVENSLIPCPVCGKKMKLIRSDGGDCRMSRECGYGFYIKCSSCSVMFGYEPDRGGMFPPETLLKLVQLWNNNKPAQSRQAPYKRRRGPFFYLSDNARAFREAADLKMTEVAEILGIAPSSIRAYELRINRAPERTVSKLAELYGVKPEDLMEVTP